MTSLGKTIKDLRQQQQLTQKDLAKLTGFKQNTISNHENEQRKLSEEDIRVYAKAFAIPPEQLFTPNKVIQIRPFSETVIQLDQELSTENHTSWVQYGQELLEEQRALDMEKELIEYRVYERLSAGVGSNYYEDYSYDSVYYDEDISHDIASWIYGDSMEPAYLNGEVALIKETGFDHDGAVYAVSWAGQTYIKRVYLEEEGFRLVSLNPKYSPLFAHKDEDPRIIGKVIGHFMPVEC